MTSWTNNQKEAILKSGTNIIVSAGAGSGKTAVLTARVLNKLENNIHINELLILTFTKAAAGEMKERIRKNIKKNPDLKEELKLLDTSYITTFDAFSLSVVKKYHYCLNLPKNIDITEETTIDILKKDTIREVLNECYEEKNESFLHLIQSFCVKNDTDIYNSVLKMTDSLEKIFTHDELLNDYFNTTYTPENQERWLNEFNQLILQKKEECQELLDNLSYSSPKEYFEKISSSLQGFLNAKELDEMIMYQNIKLPNIPKDSPEELKIEKDKITEKIKEIQKYLEYGTTEELKQSFIEIKPFIESFILIIKKYFERISLKKSQENIYDFNDIAFLSLKILKENPTILKKIKQSFKEIMVDEYQDTNDLQEEFIELISDHNVYMVGDIKQSIYRFRNANPYIFKTKYDSYKKHQNGEKIDLLKNFRSREEVLKNINQIFNNLMEDTIGGANYVKEHQMVFGNNTYVEKGKTTENYDMEIRKYPSKNELGFTKEEIEIFEIGKDILDKITNKYQLFDKEKEEIRAAVFDDFVILVDRSTTFPLFKKIFNYLHIPLNLYKDENLSQSEIFYILKNLLKLLISYFDLNFDINFRYAFTSISRSFLFEKNDTEVFQTIKEKNWFHQDIYETLKPIINNLNHLSLEEIIVQIYQQTKINSKMIKIGNIRENQTILEKIKQLAKKYGKSFHNIHDFYQYLSRIIEEEIPIHFVVEESENHSVKLMTIHKSKGLEFPICYFCGLYKSFNISELNDKFLFDTKYGFVTSYKKEGIAKHFLKECIKNHYLEEEISEKIRLFYVSLTRAEEKIILLLPVEKKSEKWDSKITNQTRKKYRSFADFIYSMEKLLESNLIDIDINRIGLTKDYLLEKTNIKKIEQLGTTISVLERNYQKEIIAQKHFSKNTNQLIKKDDYEEMKLGTKIHEILEEIDFSNPDYNYIDSNFIKNKIEKFIKSSFIQTHLKDKIYHEYEFIYDKNGEEFHGKIDLLIESNDTILIIDYKLKEIKDKNYLAQIAGYQQFIESITNKKTECYLYSILDEMFYKILTN